jgi:DNA-binding transcriptional ArsR family regulator
MNRVFKALSDPTRRRVLQLLRAGPLSAGELSDHFEVSKPTMSAHFSVLQEADLIEPERHGRTILYRLKLSVLEDALLSFAQTVGLGSARQARKSSTATTRRSVNRALRGAT